MGKALSNILCIISIVGIITCACFYVFGMRERSTYEEPLGRRLSSITELGVPPTAAYNCAIVAIDEAEKKESKSIYLGIFFILLLAISIAIRGASKQIEPKASYATGISGIIVVFIAIILIGTSFDNHKKGMREAQYNVISLLTEKTMEGYTKHSTEYEEEMHASALKELEKQYRKMFPLMWKAYESGDIDVEVKEMPKPRKK